tara:strand:- start:252 stop:590 length:339 start_codon:yes stop_codon:yes gene_type:complete
MAAIYVSNLVVNTGVNFAQTFTLSSTDSNAAFDLTGYSVKSEVRKWAGAVGVTTFDATIANATEGIIILSLTSEKTSAMKAGRHVYDIVVTSGSQKQRVVEGNVLVREGVTR